MLDFNRAYFPVAIKAWLEMVILNDSFTSLSMTNTSYSGEDNFEALLDNKASYDFKIDKFNLEAVLRQLWATWPVPANRYQPKPPLISAMIHKLCENPFESYSNKGILLLKVRDYMATDIHKKFTNNIQKHKNYSSMPIETKEHKLDNISYPIYPDGINYASVIFNEISTEMMIVLFYSLLWEEKIIIVTERYEIISLLVEAIIQLAFPFDLSTYTIIGFIDEEMIDYIHAPLPYVIGWKNELIENI